MDLSTFLLARTAPQAPPPVQADSHADRYLQLDQWCTTATAVLHELVRQETAVVEVPPAVPWDDMAMHDGQLVLYGVGDVVIATGANAERMVAKYAKPVTDTPLLRTIATLYATHPDYRTEWKP